MKTTTRESVEPNIVPFVKHMRVPSADSAGWYSLSAGDAATF